MYTLAFALLLLAQIASIAAAGLALIQAWNHRTTGVVLVEKAHLVVSTAFGLASGILLYALVQRDYSLEYVASYTDNALETFYRLAAFWTANLEMSTPATWGHFPAESRADRTPWV